MKNHNSKFAYFVFNYLRPIPMWIFGAFAYGFWKINAKKCGELYEERKQRWESIDSLQSLISFFKENYSYKYDLGRGFFDHDSSIYEWCLAYGDCDDAALYSKKKLIQLGYTAKRYGLIFKVNGKIALHFDTIFEKDGDFYLFNYGSIIGGTSIENLFENFCLRWNATGIKYSEVWY